MTFSSVIFDLDGTLLDTLTDISDSVNRALQSLGLPTHPKEAYKIFVGDGIEFLAQRVLPHHKQTPQDVQACLAAIQKEYGSGLLKQTAPFQGISDLLAELVTRQITLAVVSNKPHELTVKSIQSIFPATMFSYVVGARHGIPTKPDPAMALDAAAHLQVPPETCLYVGDTDIDMKTAKAAGMFPVGVLWGFRDKTELLASGAKQLLTKPLELLSLL